MNERTFEITACKRVNVVGKSTISTSALRTVCRAVLLTVLIVSSATHARADFHVWTGAVNGYWSNTNNWQSGNAPHLFESTPVYIEFPSGVSRTAVTNDINYGFFGPLYVDTFIVTGSYLICGIGSGTNIVMTGNPAPFFGANLQNFYCTGSGTVFDQSLNLTLQNTNTITNVAGAYLDIRAALVGSGGWTFQGLGTMVLDGPNPNSFSGTCEVDSGTLMVNHDYSFDGNPAISGPLIIGTANTAVPAVVLESGTSGQFYNIATGGTFPPVTIMPSGKFRLLGANISSALADSEEMIGPLNMTGGTISLEGLAQHAIGIGNLGTNYAALQVNGPITIYPCANSSIITGHGLGTDLYGNDSFLFQNSTFSPVLSTNVINVMANSALVMDTPVSDSGFLCYSLIKTGAGTLLTTGTNTYRSSTYLQQGTWVTGGDRPFGYNYNYTNASTSAWWIGPAQNQTVVSNGAEIIAISPFNSPVPLVLNGQGPGGTAAALDVVANGTTFSAGCAVVSATKILTGSGDEVYFDNFDNTNADVAALSGNGTLHLDGPGTVALTMSLPSTVPYTNAFTGTTYVDQGTFMLSGQPYTNLIAGPLYVSSLASTQSATVQLAVPEQIAPNAPVTIFDSGELYLSGNQQTLALLSLVGGQVAFGTVVLNGDLTAQNGVNASGFFFANLSLGGTNRNINVYPNSTCTIVGGILDGSNSAGFNKIGTGNLVLASSGTYSGLTTVSAGILTVEAAAALGGTNAGTIVSPGAELDLANGAYVDAEPLTISGTGVDGLGALKGSGTNSWAGPITLPGNLTVQIPTNCMTELSGLISGSGGLTKAGQGTLLLDGSQSNSFAGTTLVQQGVLALSKTNAVAIPGLVIIGAGIDGPNGDILRTLQGNQLAQTSAVNISSSGLFDVSLGSITRAGSITGSGSIQTGTSALMFGYDNSSTTYAGSILGTGDLTKLGSGTFTYTGAGSYSGTVELTGGQLFVNGSLPSIQVYSYAGTTLGGNGSVGPIWSGAGVLTPGNYNPGILNCGNLTLNSNDTMLIYISGTNAGSGYGQLNTSLATITLGNAHLQLNMSTLGVTNAQFTLIHNPTVHVVSGTFAGLPEGGTAMANNGVHFKITYHGNAGNDVVLTEIGLPAPPQLGHIQETGNGQVQLTGSGSAGQFYDILANSNLATTNWITIGTAQAATNGVISFTDTNAPSFRMRFYRFKAD